MQRKQQNKYLLMYRKLVQQGLKGDQGDPGQQALRGLRRSRPTRIPGTAGGGIAAGIPGNVATSGTLIFSNANGATFGMNASTITLSYSQSTHDHPYINTSDSTLFGGNTASAMNTSERAFLQYTSATSVITSNAMNTSERATSLSILLLQ